MIAPGEIVTCESGHPVYLVVESINDGEFPFRSKAYEPAREDIKPLVQYSMIMKDACGCGAVWVRTNAQGKTEIHVGAAWRQV